jgi:5-methyltetrahydropteroyltriglutamate--homocysteine methyltransferase
MPLRTTTIGSYPKPAGTPAPTTFDQRAGAWTATRAHSDFLERRVPGADAALDDAVREVVAEQVSVGIDVPTDGEIRREHYIYYHCRRLEGFDFERLSYKSMRGGGWRDEVPTITGPVRAGEPFLPYDWRVAQAAVDRPVKMTLPGPLTIVASTADEFYGDERRLAETLADALNAEIRALDTAGCRFIQVDEPVFAREPAKASDYGIELLARCFHGVSADVTRAVHVCCGYPSALDLDDYPKADPASYAALAGALDAASVDWVSIEDAHRHNDLHLLERFTHVSVALGVVDIAQTRIETAAEIEERLRAACDHIDQHRLIAAPDCGLAMLPRALAVAKLENMVAAARAI